MLDETLIADFYRALLRSENSTLCVSPKISNAAATIARANRRSGMDGPGPRLGLVMAS
jgi:hypothetical protein